MKKRTLNMKAAALLALVAVAALTACFAVSCGAASSGSDPEMTGVTFPGATYVYDGEEHTIEVAGSLPAGAVVEYTNNSATDAGEYAATAVVTADGYETLTLRATLTIRKADIAGVTFEGDSVLYDRKAHTFEVAGVVPDGVSVTYDSPNTLTEPGEYVITATLTGANYNTLTLTAKFIIVDLASAAADIVDGLLRSPDPWRFLPEALREENMAYSSVPADDFESGFVSVSQIGTRAVGVQLYGLYTMLDYAETALAYIDTLNGIGAAIADAYQSYINTNLDDYSSFSAEIAGFRIGIILDGTEYSLMAGNSVVSVELYYDPATGVRAGRIQVTDGVALKYTYDDYSLRMALKVTVAGYGLYYDLEFAREGNEAVGYLYEFVGGGSVTLYESATVIVCGDAYTWVMSAQPADGEVTVIGKEEVYDSLTGKYLGFEIQERKVTTYDTLWFQLADVSGITSVMMTDSDVYLNGNSSDAFAVDRNSLGLGSRKYYIEYRTVYYIVSSTENGKTTYSLVQTQIPMLAVQADNMSTFGSDILKKNPDIFSYEPALPDAVVTLLYANFGTMYDMYTGIIDLDSYAEIDAYIGEKNPFFDA